MTDNKLDQTISSWLETQAPTQVSDRVLRATFERTRRTRQQVGWRVLLGRLSMPRFAPALASAAIVVVVAAVALGVYSNRPGIGASPSPSPSVSPSPTVTAPLPVTPAHWTRVMVDTAAGAGGIRHIAAGPGGLIAVTELGQGGESRVLFSVDGLDWSVANVSPRGEHVSVVATDRGFLMTVSEDGAWTSENGLDWERAADNWSGNADLGGSIVVAAAAGGPGYVAVGTNNTIWYSTDGSEWSLADVPLPPGVQVQPGSPGLAIDLAYVASVDGHLVATGYVLDENNPAIDQDFVFASRDGMSWSTALEAGDRAGPLQLAAGPNGFLAIGGPLDGDAASAAWHSVDGVSWQDLGNPMFDSSSPIVWKVGVAATSSGYVALGLQRDCDVCSSEPLLWTSPDGLSWSRLTGGDPFNLDEPGRSSLYSVTAFGSSVVVGGQHDGRPAVWISAQ